MIAMPAPRRLGVIMHGVTGRMGANQHLLRSIVAIRTQGGVELANGERVMPDPMLVGRDATKLATLAQRHGLSRWTTDLAAALADPNDTLFFDAGPTDGRPALLEQALRAGKHVYCEKPIATDLPSALALARLAESSGLKNGAVQDKLYLPGLRKLDLLRRSGFFGRMLAMRIDFGYWVFEGGGESTGAGESDPQRPQRPSWNYRSEDGGGLVLDMMCHWRYVLDHLVGTPRAISCIATTQIARRWDESGRPYDVTADDAAHASIELEGFGGEPVLAQITMSWATRVRRDDLATFQIDGTDGSAVAGLTTCRIQPRAATPRPVWDPETRQPMDFYSQWQDVPDTGLVENAFKTQWEQFIRHVVDDTPYRGTLFDAAKGVQLVDAALRSSRERRWIDIPALAL